MIRITAPTGGAPDCSFALPVKTRAHEEALANGGPKVFAVVDNIDHQVGMHRMGCKRMETLFTKPHCKAA